MSMTIYGRGLRTLALATVATITLALALVFFYAPLDADQGFIQKIFYIHVPLAIVSLCGFIFGGILAIGHLRTGDRKWDMRSYVAIHMALVFSIGALITGSIWAKASWGHWWVWNEPTLVSAIAVHTRARDLIGPIIGLPLLVPALIATARAAGPLLAVRGATAPPGKWILVLALYDLVFVLVAFGVFDFLIEE